LYRSTIEGNVVNLYGGGIYSQGWLYLQDTTVRNNSGFIENSVISGGGLYIDASVAWIAYSTISSNQAAPGGGIVNQGEFDTFNTTISGNKASEVGGILNQGMACLKSVTITANTAEAASRKAEGVYGGNLYFANTIMAGNQLRENPLDCVGQVVTLGGKSLPMRHLFRLIERVAEARSTVLIQGETGTGKELVARAIHQYSPRHNRPFVAVDCGALPEPLLESELFGHVKGAFTGAISTKRGLFQEAHEGTLLLDEIGNTTLAFQAKLLRVLQEGEVRPVGGERSIKVDVRVIACTNQELTHAVAAKTFRQDLCYRLAVIPVVVPPCGSGGRISRSWSSTSCARMATSIG
jgi:transcriptional regulator of aromatic amino acid metabolism